MLKSAWRDTSLKLTIDGAEFHTFVEIGHDMFAVLGFLRFLPGFLQNLERTCFDIQANWIRAVKWRRKTICNKIKSRGSSLQ